MLYRNYTPETIFDIIDLICSNIYILDNYADIGIDLVNAKDRIYGKLFRDRPIYTKSQIKRIFREDEFELSEFIKDVNLTSYIDVKDFPINFGNGVLLDLPTKFGLHTDTENALDKSLHNLLCKYQACYLIETLLSLMNQYLTFIQKPSSNDVFIYDTEWADEDIHYLTNLQIDASNHKSKSLRKIAEVALFTDYQHELVKRVVATKFLRMKKDNSTERSITMSIKEYVDHEWQQMSKASHEIDFKNRIREKLSFDQ